MATDTPIDISIIIPFFRAEAYLDECLSSVINQDFTGEYEIVVIDDGSDDNSLEIAEQYLQINPQKIRILRKENGGVSTARNAGLEVMRGHYFLFLDADDCLTPNALQSFYDAAERYNAEVVKGNMLISQDGVRRSSRHNVKNTVIYEQEDCFNQLLLHRKIRGHAGAKFFRAEELANFRFPEGISMAEDLRYCAQVFLRATRVVVLASNVYEYRMHGQSSTDQKYVSGKYIEWLDTIDFLSSKSSNSIQVRSCLSLQIRTLNQIVREARYLPEELRQQVLESLEERRKSWGITLPFLLCRIPGDFRSIARFLKYVSSLNKMI